MNKQDFTKVLAHQLRGIMFHSDLVQLFTLLEMKRCRKFQEHQLCEELKFYLETSNLYIKEFQDIPEIGNIEKLQISESTIVAPLTESEKIKWYEKAVDMWVDWEKETFELYTEIAEEDKSKYWKCKAKNVERELERARKLQKEFILIDRPNLKSVVVLNTSNDF